MEEMILSAYWALKAAENLYATPPEISYHNITPGYVTFEKATEGNEKKQYLFPVWRILVTKKALQNAKIKADDNAIFFLDMYGHSINTAENAKFVTIETGTIFKFGNDVSIMLERCDHQHHKLFVIEPQIAIGKKKGPIFCVSQ